MNDARDRSLVYIGGAFSHAFTKLPFLRGVGDGLGEQPHDPGTAERLLAEHALESVPGGHLCPRRRRADARRLRLMELELIEPDLGLRLSPDSAVALARAILARLLAAFAISNAGDGYGILPIMDAVQKITVGISSDSLPRHSERAAQASRRRFGPAFNWWLRRRHTRGCISFAARSVFPVQRPI